MSSVDSLANDIARELQRYSHLVTEEVEVAKKEVSQELVNELKQTSPKKTGHYAKGWRTKKVGNKIIVHNATDYQLTHLLEYGHAKVGGGRVPAKVHIRPAADRAVNDYLDRVERAIRQ